MALGIKGDSFAGRYKRVNDYPIDTTDVWNTIEDARIYARNNDTEAYVPYAGQVISVLENGAIYKLVKDDSIPETDGRKHFKLAVIGSNNDNDDRYVRKDIAETIKFLMTFLEGINAKGVSTLEEVKLLKNIVSQNFSAGSTGFGITQDEQGNYHLDIDFVNIRRRLTVSEIQVQQSSYIGGKQWNTAAGIICSAVEDKGGYWRCFFNATDAEGRTVRNTFEADDQALCETFNLDKQSGGALGNHMYWRVVVSTGDNYIDLSKTLCLVGSDAPQVGDNIVQLGNRTDSSRQGAICWDSVTEGGPYVRVYDGINSFSLPQPKIDLNPTESIIKAKFISEATGKDIDSTLDDVKVDLDLIKSQTDKEYTLWFFEYEPTLNNVPASEWTTDALKTMHEQDMFYNRTTGLAYRFEKPDSSWAWNIISDQQTVKALENAAKAQDTADGKRRVFVAQPTKAQAYDVGDLWTNATAGDYINDQLVCKTAKAAGTDFDLSHWKPSSTATTAYIKNFGNSLLLEVSNAEKRMSASIAVTDGKISALANRIQMDQLGNITNISTSGLVTTSDFNSLLSKKVSFDKDGHITNIDKSGLVTESNLVNMFAEKTAADGYAKKSYINLFVKELPDGRFQSNALVSADLIRFNGKIVANDTFVVDEKGNLTLNNITVSETGLFKGRVSIADKILLENDGSGSLANGNISWSSTGESKFVGTIKSMSDTNGNCVVVGVEPRNSTIGAEDNSVKIYNGQGELVGAFGYISNSGTKGNMEMSLKDGFEQVLLSPNGLFIQTKGNSGTYSVEISPISGIQFYKDNTLIKTYPNK